MKDLIAILLFLIGLQNCSSFPLLGTSTSTTTRTSTSTSTSIAKRLREKKHRNPFKNENEYQYYHNYYNSNPTTGVLLAVPPPTGSDKSNNNDSNNNNNKPSTRRSGLPLGRGLPSAPGWKKFQLEKLKDWAINDEANRAVICEYEPDALWLWTKYRGTVLSLTLLPVLFNILVGIGVDRGVHALSLPTSSWSLLAKPPADDPIIQQLQGLNTLWGYLVTLATFILTFFTAEAYKHWKGVYFTTRAIQGRINDVCMLVTIGANRRENRRQESQELVEKITRLIKKSHTFFWAASPTCSNGVGDADGGVGEEDAIGPLLLSSEGLRGLIEEGELTAQEVEAILNSGLPPSQYTYILLEWVGLYIMQGLESGLLGHSGGGGGGSGGGSTNSGLEENLLRKMTDIRAEYFSIGDYSAGRMPLAYVQLVQVLVDSLVILAPFSLYSEIGSLSVVLTALLTLFFKGLLELSKSFLDPFGNEGYPAQNIRVDVLVSELNFGAASRWVQAAEAFPEPPPLNGDATDDANRRVSPPPATTATKQTLNEV